MSKYYVVTGKPAKKLQEMLDQRNNVFDEFRNLAKRYGACAGVSFDKVPDLKIWKFLNEDNYLPKGNTKVGKAIAKEVKQIECKAFVNSDFAKIIWPDFSWMSHTTPGILSINGTIYVDADDDYTPPKELSRYIKRISDLEYEKVTDNCF